MTAQQARELPVDQKKLPYTINFPASLIREAVGLDIDEKVMLFVIASHQSGEGWASRAKFEAQLGFRGNRIYAVRKKLKEKNLIRWETRAIGKSTKYTINKQELLRWVENPARARSLHSLDQVERQDARAKSYRPYRLGTAGVRSILHQAQGRRGRKHNTDDMPV